MWTGWLSTAWIDRPLKNTVFPPFRAGTSVEANHTGAALSMGGPGDFPLPTEPGGGQAGGVRRKMRQNSLKPYGIYAIFTLNHY